MIKRAVITGATGAIGTALIKELVSKNIEVLVLCRENSSRNDSIPMHKLVTKRYCSLEQLRSFSADDNSFDVFYHLAWNGTTGRARNDFYLQNDNVKYTLDAVAAAKRLGCNTFIGVGSQAEYGRVEGKISPSTPTNPETGYGIAKLAAGLMSQKYANQLGIRHIWTRVLSVYGPNDGTQSLIMTVINSLKEGKSPRLTKGEQVWDYLHSYDAANALYLLGEKGIDGQTYVLGSGMAKPLKEYVECIRDMIAPDIELDFGAIPYSRNQVMYLCADITRLSEEMGWNPRVSFDKGIKTILE